MIRAAEAYVRLLIRRPHAYFFIGDIFENRGGLVSATPAGGSLADGSTAPLPGIYVLNSDGSFEGSSRVSRSELLTLLKQGAAPDPSGD